MNLGLESHPNSKRLVEPQGLISYRPVIIFGLETLVFICKIMFLS